MEYLCGEAAQCRFWLQGGLSGSTLRYRQINLDGQGFFRSPKSRDVAEDVDV